MGWCNHTNVDPRSYRCGHCGSLVGSDKGYYFSDEERKGRAGKIYICPHCSEPTHFRGEGHGEQQIPGIVYGDEVKALPADVERLYREARDSISVGAYTGSVLLSRKQLMNIAVSQGAPAGKSFVQYVEYLAENGYVPPKGKGWVDHIRTKGNEATHEIVAMSKDDAEELISFSEMLLKFIYEFPSRIPPPKQR